MVRSMVTVKRRYLHDVRFPARMPKHNTVTDNYLLNRYNRVLRDARSSAKCGYPEGRLERERKE